MTIWGLTKSAFSEWQEDNAMRLGAALSYYTIFSLAPLLIIVISVAGLVFGQEAARTQILTQIHGLIGDQGAVAIEEILKNASKPSAGIIGTVVGLITLFVGATGVVAELHDSLNTIWEVDAKSPGVLFGYIRQRTVSFAIVLAIGFLLLVSLVISAGLAAIGNFFGGSETLFFQLLDFITSLIVTTGLFALMFKYLADVQISWRNVWIGAAITAILFTIGKTLTGIYLGRSAVTSTFGAAGSLVVILLWVYYSSQIVFFGAEFIQVYARERGEEIVPKVKNKTVVLKKEPPLNSGIKEPENHPHTKE